MTPKERQLANKMMDIVDNINYYIDANMSYRSSMVLFEQSRTNFRIIFFNQIIYELDFFEIQHDKDEIERKIDEFLKAKPEEIWQEIIDNFGDIKECMRVLSVALAQLKARNKIQSPVVAKNPEENPVVSEIWKI